MTTSGPREITMVLHSGRETNRRTAAHVAKTLAAISRHVR